MQLRTVCRCQRRRSTLQAAVAGRFCPPRAALKRGRASMYDHEPARTARGRGPAVLLQASCISACDCTPLHPAGGIPFLPAHVCGERPLRACLAERFHGPQLAFAQSGTLLPQRRLQPQKSRRGAAGRSLPARLLRYNGQAVLARRGASTGVSWAVQRCATITELRGARTPLRSAGHAPTTL